MLVIKSTRPAKDAGSMLTKGARIALVAENAAVIAVARPLWVESMLAGNCELPYSHPKVLEALADEPPVQEAISKVVTELWESFTYTDYLGQSFSGGEAINACKQREIQLFTLGKLNAEAYKPAEAAALVASGVWVEAETETQTKNGEKRYLSPEQLAERIECKRLLQEIGYNATPNKQSNKPVII